MKLLLFNLQLFATNVTTQQSLSAENKTYYDKLLIKTADPDLVYDQFGQKKPIPKNGGKKIEFRKFSPLAKALTPLTEGVTPTGKQLTVTKIEAEVAQYGDYVETSDVLQLTAIDPIVVETTKLIGSQAGRTLDTVTREVLMGGTNKAFAPKSDGTIVTQRDQLDATCIFTPKLVYEAERILKRQNAPKINGKYVAIIHPDVSADIMKNDQFIEVTKYASQQGTFKGEIGTIANTRFVESTEAKIWNDDTCPVGLAVYGILFVGENAYGVTEVTGGGLRTIIKSLGSAGTADPLDQRSTIGWKAIKTAERLVEQYMLRYECVSSAGNVEAN